MNSILYIALAYAVVFLVIAFYILLASHARRKYLKKLYYEGFFTKKEE